LACSKDKVPAPDGVSIEAHSKRDMRQIPTENRRGILRAFRLEIDRELD